MRLRSFLVLATVLAGACVVTLELAARSAARDIAQALEPFASLRYESAGIAVDGSVRLREPRLTINRGVWKGAVLARVADLRGGNPFWLLTHAIFSGSRLPAQMHVHARGLHLGDSGSGVPLAGWFGTSDLALFENLGCGSDALSDKDRVRMGVETPERDDEFRYQFDAAVQSLTVSMDLHSEGIAAIHGSAQLSSFAGAGFSDPASQAKLRLQRVSLGYQDFGYFSRRNQFCAQWLGTSATQYIDKHLDAVEAFLGVRGIKPGKDLLALYQQLATRGGNLNLTSLPAGSWRPSEFDAYPKEDLLRLLNVTARLDDAPPIMLRLSFTSPESPVRITSVVDPPVALSVAAAGMNIPEQGTSGPDSAIAQGTTSVEPEPAEPVTTSGLNSPADAASDAGTGRDPAGPENATDSADAPPAAQTRERQVVASAPPPPKDSTLALVWKPGVIERLPRQAVPDKAYSLIAKDRLPEMIGATVQLLTENGKRVDGDVLRVSGGAVVLSIAVTRGNAELAVPLDVVREVRLRSPGAPSL